MRSMAYNELNTRKATDKNIDLIKKEISDASTDETIGL